MKQTALSLNLLLYVSLAGVLHAQDLTGSLDDNGFIVLSGQGLTLVGFELKSAAGSLLPVPENNPDPFQLLLANNASQIAYAAPSIPVALDGDLVLATGYVGTIEDFLSDISGIWGGPEEDVGGSIAFSVPQEPLAEILPEPTGLQMLCAGILAMQLLKFRKS